MHRSHRSSRLRLPRSATAAYWNSQLQTNAVAMGMNLLKIKALP
jgi:hypothetical protein